MLTRYINGDVFNTNAPVILHQVNCRGVMGSGIAAQVKERYPSVYTEYSNYVRMHNTKELFGECLIVPVDNNKYICNLFGQTNYGTDKNKRYTSYDALDMALYKLKKWCVENHIKTIALPRLMGCDRGGGTWAIVSAIVFACFQDTEICIEIWSKELQIK